MSIKKKMFLVVSLFCILIAAIMTGVWALKTINVDIGGKITFTGSGIKATISQGTLSDTGVWQTAGDASLKMREVVFTNSASDDSLDDVISSWQSLKLLFNEDGDEVTISFSITNNSKKAGEYIAVNVDLANGVMNNAIASISKTSTTIAPEGTANFVITFSVLDTDLSASLTGFNLNFDMQLAKNGVEASTLSDLAFTYYDSTMTASVKGNNASATSITIPEYVLNGGKLYTVTTIGDEAFRNYSSLKTLSVPNTISKIGTYFLSGCSAFQWKKENNGWYVGNNENPYLILRTIDSNVQTTINSFEIKEETEILYGSFSGCTSLASISIPSSVRYMREAFSGCTALASVTFSEGLKDLDYNAFFNCTNLVSVNLPSTLKSIGEQAFTMCTKLQTISLPDNLTTIGKSVFGNCSSLKRIVIPVLVESIKDMTFLRCSELEEVILSKNTKSIDYAGFYECKKLATLSNTDSLTTLGWCALRDCDALTSIVLPSITDIGQGAFIYCDGLTTVIVGDKLVNIGIEAFNECKKLKSINLQEGLKTIYNGAFQACSSLEYVYLPNSVEFIGDLAFNHCSKLKFESFKLPANIKQLGGRAYDPENPSTTVIGSHVFYDFATNSIKEFVLDAANQYYMVVDGVLYRKENGVPTVLVAYPADKRDTVYEMPDTVVNAYELSLSRAFHLREIVLSDSFIIKEMTDGTFLDNGYANNLMAMIYVYSGVISIKCKDTNENYISFNGCVYSKDGTTLYYAPYYDGTLADSEDENVLYLKDGITTIAFGSIGHDGDRLSNVASDGTNVYEENHFKRYKKLVIPASVTTIPAATVTAINKLSWTIVVEDGNTAFEVVDGKLAAKA